MTVQDLIYRIRDNVHDNDELEYDDSTLIAYINDGARFVRRTLLDIDSALLAGDPIEGETEEGQKYISLEQSVSSIIYVVVNGRKLKAINIRDIAEPGQMGDPEAYYVTSFKNINLYPTPEGVVSYKILAVPDMTPFTDVTDEVPYMNELIDFIVEYATIRSSVTNEFDVSQEQSIMGSIVSQIERLVRRYNCKGVQTDGYWNRPLARRGYW